MYETKIKQFGYCGLNPHLKPLDHDDSAYGFQKRRFGDVFEMKLKDQVGNTF